MVWINLEDGQKIKALDNIRLYNTKSILIDEENSIYLTDEENSIYLTDDQIKNSSELIANAGDIGTWNKGYGYLEFILNGIDGKYTQVLDFGSNITNPKIDEKLFKIIKD